jgi:PTH1 family peptidyl-tRNA hydrolase
MMKLFSRREEKTTYLIVGLGNHGLAYKNNRHNIGYMTVDHLAKTWGETISKTKARSLTLIHQIDGTRVILAKPQTFMNDSGRAVEELLRYYKIPLEHMLVVYDELDLPLGSIRLRPFGGTGGHRGMRSIQNTIRSQEFPRMRIGIDRPPGRMDPADYVLQDFSPEEQETVLDAIERAVECLKVYLRQGIEEAMNSCNTSPEAQ